MNILDPRFKWIPPDADSTAFRDRQRARVAQIQRAKADAAESRVGLSPALAPGAASSPPIPLRRNRRIG